MMKLRLCACLSVIILTIVGFISTGNTQPSKIPPVAVGPQTLSGFGGSVGFHEFFTQPGPDSLKGDIFGIAAPDSYWVYVTGIDASGVTGPQGRKIVFNLQDSETGSSFKNLGISFALQIPGAGTDFLECYQADGIDGISTHGLGLGTLTTATLDLRFLFTKLDSVNNWEIRPEFRLNSGSWTLFFDGSFTADESFDFLGAKLTVGFLNGAAGAVSFDNFFVIGPINPPITETFVDDDWSGIALGDAVQFPGQFNVQVFGVNAFATIQGGIDSLQAQGALGTVNVAPGDYLENIQIDSLVHIVGSGSGNNPLVDTIVRSATLGVSTITINGSTASGTSPTNRFMLSNMKVTDATIGKTLMKISGILVLSMSDTTSHMTFDNITAEDNVCGISFAEGGNEETSIALKQNGTASRQTAFFNDIEILNSSFLNNDNTGIFIDLTTTAFDSLIVSKCDITDNGQYGFSSSGLVDLNNVHMDSTTFSGNGGGSILQPAVSTKVNGTQTKFFGLPTILTGDIHMINFNGDASFTDVTITGNNEAYGIELRGYDDSQVSVSARSLPSVTFTVGPTPSGTVTFTDFKVDGSFDEQRFEYGSGMLIADYSDITNMTFTNVDLDVTPTAEVGVDSVANLYFCHIDSTFDLNDTKFGGNASMDIVNLDSLDIDATGATFTGAADNFAIEDRVIHEIDLYTQGLVTWDPDNVYLTRNSFVVSLDTSATLQRAIDAASAGDTVNISPENYWDGPQLVIDKSLTIKGAGKTKTTFRAQVNTGISGDSRAWFLVNAGVNLNLQKMTLDGNGFLIHEAIRFNGHGTVDSVCFNEIKYNESGPDYSGYGVYAPMSDSVMVTNCTFTEMGRTGAYYSGSLPVACKFTGNTYTGKGAGNWLDFAAEIDFGANVEVANCKISDNLGVLIPVLGKTAKNETRQSLSVTASAGVFVNDVSSNGTIANIHDNDISNSSRGVQVGIGTGETNFVTLMQNEIYGNEFGVLTWSALFMGVENNHIYNNDYGVFFEHVTVFDVDLNDLHNNDYAIHLFTSFGEVDDNTIYNNTTRGIIVTDESSTGTTINGNEFCNNAIYALENMGTTTMNATANWWGASNGPGGAGPGAGDSVSVNVNFASFATGSFFPNSPCENDAACISDGDIDEDGFLTPGDAFCAFNIFLNSQTLPANCNVDTSLCELIAADVDCDAIITPGDAFGIFNGFLTQQAPAECFAQPGMAITKLAVSELSVTQHTTLKSNLSDENTFQVTLAVDRPNSLESFGLDLNFPADKIEFDKIERTGLTASWTELQALVAEPGLLRIGGFNVQAEKSTATTKQLIIIHFKATKAVMETLDLEVSNLVNDLAAANIKMIDQGISEVVAIPDAFGLHQNYPNPFNPSTLIQFDLPAEAADGVKITLAIYNVTGQLVRTLLAEERKAGIHSILWNAKNDAGVQMPSGTYFYKIRAGDFTASRKMILLK